MWRGASPRFSVQEFLGSISVELTEPKGQYDVGQVVQSANWHPFVEWECETQNSLKVKRKKGEQIM